MLRNVNEKDWQLFRRLLPVWQEAYMEKLVEGYKALLNSKNRASEKFWALEERIIQDKKSPGVLIDNARRSNIEMHLRKLLCSGVICHEDLTDFSPELKNSLQGW